MVTRLSPHKKSRALLPFFALEKLSAYIAIGTEAVNFREGLLNSFASDLLNGVTFIFKLA